jgi:Zn finger protein HypA/HybF involved in hydrogenase expression
LKCQILIVSINVKQNNYTTKKKNRRSPIWKTSDDNFINLVKNSKTTTEVLAHFGLKNKGGNNRTVKQRIKELGLDISHFMNNIDASSLSRKVDIISFKNEWLTENSYKTRGHLKNYLLKFNLLEWKCRDCGNNGNWNGKKIVLQLEHINGISDDNRLENLCFLCPNCHSQTETFAGKSQRKERNFFCSNCNNNITKGSRICLKCNGKNKQKIKWPDDENLTILVKTYSLVKLGKMLGVSDNAIRKHCKSKNIIFK